MQIEKKSAVHIGYEAMWAVELLRTRE